MNYTDPSDPTQRDNIITKDTKVSDILKNYGDLEEIMESFGIKSIGQWNIRKVITKFITVELAAKIHKIPLDDFLIN